MGLLDHYRRSRRGADQPARSRAGGFGRLLSRTGQALRQLLMGKDPLSEEFYDQLMESLVEADLGVKVAEALVVWLRSEAAKQGVGTPREIRRLLAERITELLSEVPPPEPLPTDRLSVILLVGVNGSGKTTFAAKLASLLRELGAKVLLVAADTYRAAAIEQLRTWGERIGVEVFATQYGADPAAVCFDALRHAQARGFQVVIVDTAGRVQSRKNLMEELAKLRRALDKAVEGVRVATLITVDATAGQNVLDQVKLFGEAAPLEGMVLNKLDGTAKGGIAFTASRLHSVPILFVGTGEGVEDLAEFDPLAYARSLVGEGEASG